MEQVKQQSLPGMKRLSHLQEQWEWPIAVYLYMAGLGAGAITIGLFTKWILHPDIPSMAVLLWGPILVAFGAPFLILDLGKKPRFINASRNPWTSWAGRGFLILSTLIVVGLITFAVSLLPAVLPLLNIAVPQWLDPSLPLFRALEIVAVVFSVGTAAYTGVFLKSTRYVGLWNTWMLPLLFTVSALSTGSMGIIVSLMGYGLAVNNEVLKELSHTLMPVEQVLVGIEAVVLASYVILRHRAGNSATASVKALVAGRFKMVFWGGIVCLGLVLPVVLEQVYRLLPDYPALLFVTGASLLLGGFFLRYGVVKGGIKDQHPLNRMVPLQYAWSDLAVGNAASERGSSRG